MSDDKINARLQRAGIKTAGPSTIPDQIQQKISVKSEQLKENAYSKNPQDFNQDLQGFGIKPPADVSLISKKDLSDLKKKVEAKMVNSIIKSAALDNSSAEVSLENLVKQFEVSNKDVIQDNKEVVKEFEIQSLTNKSLFPENMRGDDFASKLCRIRADEAWIKNPSSKNDCVTSAQELVRTKIIAEAVKIGEEVRKLEELSDFINAHGSIKNLKELSEETKHLTIPGILQAAKILQDITNIDPTVDKPMSVSDRAKMFEKNQQTNNKPLGKHTKDELPNKNHSKTVVQVH